MMRHVSAEKLARFGQGDLSARRSARIRAHLAGCVRCSGLNDDLAGVTTLLADAQPPPIPEHLSARIHTALAAEAAKRATLTAATGNAGAETAGVAAPDAPAPRRAVGSPRHERRHARGRGFPLSSPVALRTMAGAAAAVLIAGGGYEIAQHTGGSTPSSGSSSGGSAATPAAGGPLKPASGSAAPQLHYQYAGRQDSVTAIASGTNYVPATLSGQVNRELGRSSSQAAGQAGHSMRSTLAQGTGSAATIGTVPVSRLQGCVSLVAAGQQVLLVDVARYQGKQATVIVTRASAGGPEQVWVVGTACSDTRRDLLTHVTLAAAS